MVHQSLALISVAGFVLRWAWRMAHSPLSAHPITRVLPHVVDTVFLLSGIALAWQLSLLSTPPSWLWSKLYGLVLYILLGAVAMRTVRHPSISTVFFASALAVFGWIVSVAIFKSPFGIAASFPA